MDATWVSIIYLHNHPRKVEWMTGIYSFKVGPVRCIVIFIVAVVILIFFINSIYALLHVFRHTTSRQITKLYCCCSVVKNFYYLLKFIIRIVGIIVFFLLLFFFLCKWSRWRRRQIQVSKDICVIEPNDNMLQVPSNILT